tara:strand:- start:110 stop:343 length:234 start_codon:yes stop_codon:yes gene_type:complete
MSQQLLIAESLLDWIEITMAEMYYKDFSEEELKQKCKRIRSFIKGYRAGEEQISDLMLQDEWQEVRQYAFKLKSEVH